MGYRNPKGSSSPSNDIGKTIAKWVRWAISVGTAFAIQVGLYQVISEGIQDAPARAVVRLISFAGSVYGMYRLLDWLDKRRIERDRQ